MARKRLHEDHENLERWLVSYADFITLLFAFFVVLYAMSSINQGKYKILTESLITAFRTDPRTLDPIQAGQIKIIRSPNIVNAELVQADNQVQKPLPDKDDEHNLQQMADEIEKAMARLIEQNFIEVRRFETFLEVEINTNILFPSGSARLVTNALPVLTEIARILRRFPNPINVEGFTDSVPISTAEFPSNWELSAGRAASVVHLFTREGVEPKRMSAVGYGQYRPAAANTSAEGRSKNRRVILVVSAYGNEIRKRQAVGAENLAKHVPNPPSVLSPIQPAAPVSPIVPPKITTPNAPLKPMERPR